MPVGTLSPPFLQRCWRVRVAMPVRMSHESLCLFLTDCLKRAFTGAGGRMAAKMREMCALKDGDQLDEHISQYIRTRWALMIEERSPAEAVRVLDRALSATPLLPESS